MTRPFGPLAPWNLLSSTLAPDPGSAALAAAWWDAVSDVPGQVSLALSGYTYPVYDVSTATTTAQVRFRASGLGNLHGMVIPWSPDWRPSQDRDGWMILIDPASGQEWDLWQVAYDGVYVWVSDGSLVPDSYWTREVGWTASGQAGIPLLAMLTTPDDIEAGVIDHAMAMTITSVAGGVYVAPATRAPGQGAATALTSIPVGTRFTLSMTDQEVADFVDALPDAVAEQTRDVVAVIITALRRYGWVIVGTGNGNLLFQDRISVGDRWDELGLMDQAQGSVLWPRDLLTGLFLPERVIALAASDMQGLP